MQIDLHNFTLKDAKEIINKNIEYCIKNNIYNLEIIHGFNNGSKIKNYLKNSKTLRNTYPNIKEIIPDLLNSGKTTIYFNIQIKRLHD